MDDIRQPLRDLSISRSKCCRSRYILVREINQTSLGEGKTTTSIGLALGLARKGAQGLICDRGLLRYSADAGIAEEAGRRTY